MIFLYVEPLNPGKEGKNAQKSKDILCNEKSKEIQKSKDRKIRVSKYFPGVEMLTSSIEGSGLSRLPLFKEESTWFGGGGHPRWWGHPRRWGGVEGLHSGPDGVSAQQRWGLNIVFGGRRLQGKSRTKRRFLGGWKFRRSHYQPLTPVLLISVVLHLPFLSRLLLQKYALLLAESHLWYCDTFPEV